jgi:hypothetical protein
VDKQPAGAKRALDRGDEPDDGVRCEAEEVEVAFAGLREAEGFVLAGGAPLIVAATSSGRRRSRSRARISR